MTEKELIKAFTNYIVTEKQYKPNCLAFDYAFSSKTGNKSSIDLIVFDDSIINMPLAIIEFKTIIPADGAQTDRIKEQIEYASITKIPAFLICPSEDQYSIYEFIDDAWKLIESSDFPDFQTLKNIVEAREKLKEFEDKKKAQAKERKIRKRKAYTSIISISIAILGGLLSVYKLGDIVTVNKNNDTPFDEHIFNKIDSLKIDLEENKKNTTLFTEQYAKVLSSSDSIKDSIQLNRYYQVELLKMKNELEILKQNNLVAINDLSLIKNLISKDPLYLIELNSIRTDITLLENDFDNAIKLIKSDVESIDEKYNIFLGGIITLIVSFLILAVPNLIQGIKNTKANK